MNPMTAVALLALLVASRRVACWSIIAVNVMLPAATESAADSSVSSGVLPVSR